MTLNKFIGIYKKNERPQECIVEYGATRLEEILTEILEDDYFRGYGEITRQHIVINLIKELQNVIDDITRYYKE